MSRVREACSIPEAYRFPMERQAQETRIICRIKPRKITLDAIHK